MKAVAILARVVLGLTFILASADKLRNPAAFAEIVYNYQLLPDLLVNPVALVLPFLELTCGLALVAGRLALGAAAIVAGLMAVFMAALGFNVWRGLDVACGCFSTASSADPMSPATLARDAAILLLALLVFAREWRIRRS
jgi:uncharacterized membrane protein YphA (DoxX/SURF4 family)